MPTATGQVPDLNLREALPMIFPKSKFWLRAVGVVTAGVKPAARHCGAFSLSIDTHP
ncbi:MAG: hypothetical protein JSR67_11610 [Proteobacteria bacterium]|nr:hypothetical protein [Pseudomonadota bacterium]